jgi:hypothetical protein
LDKCLFDLRQTFKCPIAEAFMFVLRVIRQNNPDSRQEVVENDLMPSGKSQSISV